MVIFLSLAIMEQAEASEPKRVVALAIDESEHAEKALECKSFYYYAEHFIDKNVGKFKKKKKKKKASGKTVSVYQYANRDDSCQPARHRCSRIQDMDLVTCNE